MRLFVRSYYQPISFSRKRPTDTLALAGRSTRTRSTNTTPFCYFDSLDVTINLISDTTN